MGDIEPVSEAGLYRAAQLVRIGAGGSGDFQRDQGLGFGQGPGMEMGHARDAVDLGQQVGLYVFGIEPGRRTFQKDMAGLAGNAHPGDEDQQGHQR